MSSSSLAILLAISATVQAVLLWHQREPQPVQVTEGLPLPLRLASIDSGRDMAATAEECRVHVLCTRGCPYCAQLALSTNGDESLGWVIVGSRDDAAWFSDTFGVPKARIASAVLLPTLRSRLKLSYFSLPATPLYIDLDANGVVQKISVNRDEIQTDADCKS